MSDSEKSVNSPTYSCKTCNKLFATPQALEGHQGAHRQPKNAGATSSPAATKTPPSHVICPIPPFHPPYSPTTTNSTWGGSSGTGLEFNLLTSSSNSSGPSLHELPLFPMTNQEPSNSSGPSLHELPLFPMTNQEPDTTLHL